MNSDDNKPPSEFTRAKRMALLIIKSHSQNYSEDVFPKPKQGSSIDLFSAEMARHTCRILYKKIMELK